jgi:hypothetical protein
MDKTVHCLSCEALVGEYGKGTSCPRCADFFTLAKELDAVDREGFWEPPPDPSVPKVEYWN